LGLLCVAVAIDLDHQLGGRAEEVDDEAIDRIWRRNPKPASWPRRRYLQSRCSAGVSSRRSWRARVCTAREARQRRGGESGIGGLYIKRVGTRAIWARFTRWPPP